MAIIDTPIKYLKGIGEQRAKLFAKLGINTIRNLLLYLPTRYEDRRQYKKIAELKDNETVTVSGTVELTEVVNINPKLAVFKAAISDSTGIIYAVFYKRPNYRYDVFSKLKRDFVKGKKVILHGKVEKIYTAKQLNVEEYELLSEDTSDLLHTNRIVPIYNLTEGLNNRFFRSCVKLALENYSENYPEIISDKYLKKANLLSSKAAINQIHFPENFHIIKKAREKLAFDEFLLFELAMIISNRKRLRNKKFQKYIIKKHLLTPFKYNLGFEFTKAQKKVINEIFRDMQSPHPMNRLLIGDVGSGKTVVALSAILLAIENGYQAALMAPTEILAEQHFLTLKHFLRGLDVKIDLLIGSTQAKLKKLIKEKLLSGKIDLIIGTHTLLEQNVQFKNLALVVIDEQHKFGVAQREKLYMKTRTNYATTSDGKTELSERVIGGYDVLIMTATPIPRTLALTIYGDLDISTIDELPPNRLPVITYHKTDEEAYEFVRQQLIAGHQAYIVFPLVNESDKLELKSAVKEAKRLKEEIFQEFQVALLHGQMKGEEKERVMLDFYHKKYNLLITTTVIEIGIDVPDATVIVIEHADRFGLATLHQLRGRVGRSKNKQSYCILVGEPKTDDARKRLEIMLSTNNGFEIAELDLKLRGSGEFLGHAQHGESEIKIGNLVTDLDIINLAKKLGTEILSNDSQLTNIENVTLRAELLRKYHKKFYLPQIG